MITKITGVLEFECIVCKYIMVFSIRYVFVLLLLFRCVCVCMRVYAGVCGCVCVCMHVCVCADCRVDNAFNAKGGAIFIHFVCEVLVCTYLYLCLPSNYTTKLFNIDSIFPALKTNH